MLFSKLSERLEEEECKVLKTTRQYREVIQLLRLKGVKARVVGRHGGGSLHGKLEASIQRTLKLIPLVRKWMPDLAVSFSSPEASRVAFGLGIPHICINHSPHAEAVAKLTIPLSEKLLTPMVIPKKVWMRFGISGDRIVHYNALDAWAWLKGFKPNEKVLEKLGLDRSKPILTFRTEEALAAYLLGKAKERTMTLPIIEKLLERNPDLQIVLIPRYEEEIAELRKKLGDRIIVPESVVDGPSLLSFSSIFIGAGGTMTIEAALLGVPAFSCYPDKPFIIEEYLIRKGLISRGKNLEDLISKIVKTLRRLDSVRKRQREKAKNLTKSFEDPVDIIFNTIMEVAESR